MVFNSLTYFRVFLIGTWLLLSLGYLVINNSLFFCEFLFLRNIVLEKIMNYIKYYVPESRDVWKFASAKFKMG